MSAFDYYAVVNIVYISLEPYFMLNFANKTKKIDYTMA